MTAREARLTLTNCRTVALRFSVAGACEKDSHMSSVAFLRTSLTSSSLPHSTLQVEEPVQENWQSKLVSQTSFTASLAVN
jgi:hypothetical protein